VTFDEEVEWLRVRIESALGEKYKGHPDGPLTRALIEGDLAVIRSLFPELDITVLVNNDPQREERPNVKRRPGVCHRCGWRGYVTRVRGFKRYGSICVDCTNELKHGH
jgi:hypothetical protein